MWRGAKVSRGLKIDVEEWVGGKRVQWAVEAGEMAVVEWDRNGVFAVDVDVDVVDTDRKPRIDGVGTDTLEAGRRRHVLDRLEVRAMIDLISTVLRSQSLFLDWYDLRVCERKLNRISLLIDGKVKQGSMRAQRAAYHVRDPLYTFQPWCAAVPYLLRFDPSCYCDNDEGRTSETTFRLLVFLVFTRSACASLRGYDRDDNGQKRKKRIEGVTIVWLSGHDYDPCEIYIYPHPRSAIDRTNMLHAFPTKHPHPIR